jgi:hypothetical protein
MPAMWTAACDTGGMKTLLLFPLCAAALAAGPGMVRAVSFEKFHGVSPREIVQRLHDRDIELVERPYDAQNVATAQQVVSELLAEKSGGRTEVKATVTSLRGGAVKVTFAPAK